MPSTFVEKVFGAPSGSIVFHKPDLVLTHDNTASIRKTFEKMGGKEVFDPERLVVVLDHNAPPTSATLANSYQSIRAFVEEQGVKKFHDAGSGICHEIMARYARPGMVIVGSDSHTCTSGAFNAMAAGIDRTEAAGLLAYEKFNNGVNTNIVYLTNGESQPDYGSAIISEPDISKPRCAFIFPRLKTDRRIKIEIQRIMV